MSLALFVSPWWQYQNDNGGNAAGWKLFTYEPGTSTPKAAYKDSSGTEAHTNPIVFDALGSAEIWLNGPYKFVLTDESGVTKKTADNVTGYGSGVQTGYLTKSVAGSANVALTASEQSNAVIEFTGELTGNINVTVGDDKDGYRWTLINNTTGSFTLTFKATSGTGAVIDQGAEAVVYHDGTNIVELLTVTAAGKALMDDATADAQLDTLGGSAVGKAVFAAADEAAARSAIDAPSTTEAEPTLLAEYVVTGSAVTSVQFTGLDINTHKSYRIEAEIENSSGSTATYHLFVNGDTSATNYYSQYIDGDGATVTGGLENAPKLKDIGATESAACWAALTISGGYPSYTTQSVRRPAASVRVRVRAGRKTATVANITQVDIVSTVATAIGIGSKFRIYRGDK